MRRERDGSVGLRDAKGASRAIAIDLIEVRTAGPARRRRLGVTGRAGWSYRTAASALSRP